jgi:hypothetical protein
LVFVPTMIYPGHRTRQFRARGERVAEGAGTLRIVPSPRSRMMASQQIGLSATIKRGTVERGSDCPRANACPIRIATAEVSLPLRLRYS